MCVEYRKKAVNWTLSHWAITAGLQAWGKERVKAGERRRVREMVDRLDLTASFGPCAQRRKNRPSMKRVKKELHWITGRRLGQFLQAYVKMEKRARRGDSI